MKLKNKETGEVGEVKWDEQYKAIAVETDIHYYCYSSVDELNSEWEDAPEDPKEYWLINPEGEVALVHEEYEDEEDTKATKEIGNYFETKEEAELAVRKLKAWKRLKDKGFRFTGIAGISNNIFVSFETDSKYSGGHIMYDEYSNTDDKLKEYNEDLTLLFGGEE